MTRKMYQVCLIVFTLIIISSVYATDSYDLDRILTSETLFFHEYDYQFNSTLEWDWYSRDTGFRVTAGSIASNRFYFDMDAKLRARIHKYLILGYRYCRVESFTENTETNRLDMAYVNGKWVAGICGMTASEKKNTDLGLLAGYTIDDTHWITCRFLWVDIVFNSKNSDGSEYVNQPFNIEVEGIWRSSGISVIGNINIGNTWKFKGEDNLRVYNELKGYVSLEYRINNRDRLNLEMNFNRLANSFEFQELQDEETELNISRYFFTYTHAFSSRYVGTAGVTVINVTGIGNDKPRDEEITNIEEFHFSRLDRGLLFKMTCNLANEQMLQSIVHAGLVTVDAGESVQFEDIGETFAGKISGKYTKRFSDRGEITVSIAYKLGENTFGGGNFLVVFYV
ncbi:hypothetical protein K8T06_18080 [bacterium]|nr:hypothetical protein [bacterium]